MHDGAMRIAGLSLSTSSQLQYMFFIGSVSEAQQVQSARRGGLAEQKSLQEVLPG